MITRQRTGHHYCLRGDESAVPAVSLVDSVLGFEVLEVPIFIFLADMADIEASHDPRKISVVRETDGGREQKLPDDCGTDGRYYDVLPPSGPVSLTGIRPDDRR